MFDTAVEVVAVAFKFLTDARILQHRDFEFDTARSPNDMRRIGGRYLHIEKVFRRQVFMQRNLHW